MHAKHEFALYVSRLSASKAGQTITADASLAHRVKNVLRLRQEDTVILFDDVFYVTAQITQIEKRSVSFTVLSFDKIHPLEPTINLMLPFLKPDAFEAALYTSVEMGATTVQPVFVRKGHARLFSAERILKVMRAAAEQSKNFYIPPVHAPLEFEQLINQIAQKQEPIIFFDPQGATLLETFGAVQNKLTKMAKPSLILMIGPEGDLTDEEKNALRELGVQFCALTPTILRSFQALAVGLGAFRSLLKKS